ncbi:hypothetical protein [Croceimicrobium sp.]|uniref:hypothetical protein n=1 Tax=Croceimicrobium sp. TaxID=2828340 RepID=UPI003BAA08ED
MNNTLYYGEIVAKISGHLASDPFNAERIEAFMDRVEAERGETIWGLCAEAARIFEIVEDQCDTYFIDWMNAIDHYSQSIKDQLLDKKKPEAIDLFNMSVKSIRAIQSDQLEL